MRTLSKRELRALLQRAEGVIAEHRERDFQTSYPEAERMLCDLDHFPHHFVLGCVMDRQIKAERAWAIPYLVGEEIGSFSFESYEKVSLRRLREVFARRKLHRFNEEMPANFKKAIMKIRSCYHGNARNIWLRNPQAAAVVRKFLEFDGVGIKIATMATNILVRKFDIPMKNKSSIDISPDIQVMKYFVRKGLIRKDADRLELVYLARELSPDYPGRLDALAWQGGRDLR